MKTNKELLKSGWRSAAAAVALSACLVNFTACNKYDLDENDPEGWGASIYSYLVEDGHYTNTVRLIDDLGLREVLGKTGSKTMFVADDDADGGSKAKSLAEAVHSREIESSSDIAEAEIGGLPFYLLSFASKTTEGKLRYEGYGQTPPDENGDFHFVIVALENVRDNEEYTVLKPVLDSLEFKF